jgi:hypothetical protein
MCVGEFLLEAKDARVRDLARVVSSHACHGNGTSSLKWLL